jgi:ubiquinone/menaquinone biosynthesis C-methylase UbiE
MVHRLTPEERETLDAHDRIATYWDQLNPRRLKDINFSDFYRRIPHGGLVLDSGCATGGRDIPLVRSEGLRYAGVDISGNMLAVGRKKFPGTGISFTQMDICDLAFPRETFDGFLLVNTLQNIPYAHTPKVLAEHHRVLRQSGVGLLTVVTAGHSAGMNYSSNTDEDVLIVSWKENDFKRVLSNARFKILHRWPLRVATLYIVGKK